MSEITFSSEYIPANVVLMLATASESSQNLLEPEPCMHSYNKIEV